MSINWKLRLQNKTTLVTLITTIVAFVYSALSILGITPSIGQDQVMSIVSMIVSFLAAVGIVVDPTTSGVSDSARAMNYDAPSQESE